MSEYTSTREGFQRAMKWSLTGTPEDAKLYAEATTAPGFYQIFNNKRLEYDEYVNNIAEWRAKISELTFSLYLWHSEEFLRDGDQLAARMTGTIKVDGVSTYFEAFLFAKVNKDGKMESMLDRSIWGEVGKAPGHGA
ncbi:mitochondrial substrate carrier [Fusarium albosuccineum]|uniref:Mitochondrial substrate carrier n=1 Tax=Fusarium albosuccineum TaxID=1237068 RepID=A0A8H4L373_9HYPO|nr:mitochondrial substrate carrier [Fusarium albosuccineum]